MLSAIVSTGVIAVVQQESQGLRYVRQNLLWTIPGLPPEKEAQLNKFNNQLMG